MDRMLDPKRLGEAVQLGQQEHLEFLLDQDAIFEPVDPDASHTDITDADAEYDHSAEEDDGPLERSARAKLAVKTELVARLEESAASQLFLLRDAELDDNGGVADDHSDAEHVNSGDVIHTNRTTSPAYAQYHAMSDQQRRSVIEWMAEDPTSREQVDELEQLSRYKLAVIDRDYGEVRELLKDHPIAWGWYWKQRRFRRVTPADAIRHTGGDVTDNIISNTSSQVSRMTTTDCREYVDEYLTLSTDEVKDVVDTVTRFQATENMIGRQEHRRYSAMAYIRAHHLRAISKYKDCPAALDVFLQAMRRVDAPEANAEAMRFLEKTRGRNEGTEGEDAESDASTHPRTAGPSPPNGRKRKRTANDTSKKRRAWKGRVSDEMLSEGDLSS